MRPFENSRLLPEDDPDEIYSAHASDNYPRISQITVEVLLVGMSEHMLRIKADEDSPARWVHRQGIKILSMSDPTATLSMTEAKAIDLGLV
jgi:hypothetical protein